jgi:hypothetical protein
MQDIPIVNENSSVSVSEDKLVLMKVDKELPSLSGSSYFHSSYYSLQYYPKVSKPLAKPINKSNQFKIKRKFKINKKCVIQKSLSLSSLKQSQKFLAFYSISFPKGFPDESAIKCLNSWLTKIRQNSLKFNYIWVAERQKNKTIHFHILLNKWLNIKITNFYMSKSINATIISDKLFDLNFDYKKYNGVDVIRVNNSKDVSNYITKYTTKGKDVFNCKAWGCDWLTSRLFTKISDYFGSVYDDICNFVNKSGSAFNVFSNDFCYIIWFEKMFKNNLLLRLRDINEKIFSDYNQDYCLKIRGLGNTDLSVRY